MTSTLQELVWWLDNLREDERPEALLKQARAELAPPNMTERNACFDYHIDAVTHQVIEEFEWLGLPDPGGDQLSDLMVEINDALTAILKPFK